MKYFLDTNICIYILNQRPVELLSKIQQVFPAEIGISTIVLSELHYGIAKSNRIEPNLRKLEAFLSGFQLVQYDRQAAVAYGKIRAELEKKGELIGREDMLIAAHAVAQDATLVTNNEREFLRVPNLKVENWVQKAS